jgi:glutathione S-transferase
MKPVITAFESSPDRGRGQARDMRVRWAFEEVGQPYDVRLVSFAEMKQPAHRALQPFGQIPTYEQDDLALFESGAIVMHIACNHAGLLPIDANARARAIAWMFAAVSTVEPPIVEREAAGYTAADKSWYAEHLEMVEGRLRVRRIQRGRPDDGDGAQAAERIRAAGGTRQPRGLCRAGRGAAGLQAGIRSAGGGVQCGGGSVRPQTTPRSRPRTPPTSPATSPRGERVASRGPNAPWRAWSRRPGPSHRAPGRRAGPRSGRRACAAGP